MIKHQRQCLLTDQCERNVDTRQRGYLCHGIWLIVDGLLFAAAAPSALGLRPQRRRDDTTKSCESLRRLSRWLRPRFAR
jgi:hypothetical protein